MSFSRYNPEDSVISSETVVRGLWSGDAIELTTFVTQSTPTEYYVDVYKDATSTVQFSIQYGNISGSGSLPINPAVSSSTPSRICLLYTSPSPRDRQKSRMPSSA